MTMVLMALVSYDMSWVVRISSKVNETHEKINKISKGSVSD